MRKQRQFGTSFRLKKFACTHNDFCKSIIFKFVLIRFVSTLLTDFKNVFFCFCYFLLEACSNTAYFIMCNEILRKGSNIPTLNVLKPTRFSSDCTTKLVLLLVAEFSLHLRIEITSHPVQQVLTSSTWV